MEVGDCDDVVLPVLVRESGPQQLNANAGSQGRYKGCVINKA